VPPLAPNPGDATVCADWNSFTDYTKILFLYFYVGRRSIFSILPFLWSVYMLYAGCCDKKKQSPRKTSVYQQRQNEIEPNFRTLYVSLCWSILLILLTFLIWFNVYYKVVIVKSAFCKWAYSRSSAFHDKRIKLRRACSVQRFKRFSNVLKLQRLSVVL